MLHLRRYPLDCQLAVAIYAGLAYRLAAAASIELDDINQEIAIAVLKGQSPAQAVPAALGIRRLGKSWIALDPTAHPYLDVEEMGDDLVGESPDGPDPEEELGIGGMAQIALRLGVTRRRAQQLAAAQRRRVEAGGDLFGMGG